MKTYPLGLLEPASHSQVVSSPGKGSFFLRAALRARARCCSHQGRVSSVSRKQLVVVSDDAHIKRAGPSTRVQATEERTWSCCRRHLTIFKLHETIPDSTRIIARAMMITPHVFAGDCRFAGVANAGLATGPVRLVILSEADPNIGCVELTAKFWPKC